MASQRLTRLLCASDPRGSETALEQMVDAADRHEAQAVALVGDLSGDDSASDAYRALLRGVASGGRPTYWVPGPQDAPVEDLLREAQDMEVVAPHVHCIHGTAAFATSHYVFAGLGGEIGDHPGDPRDEIQRLHYPRWEPEFRLKLLGDLDEYQRVLLFWSRPAHKGMGTAGVEVLAELINTHRPRVVVCGGERAIAMLGRSRVVSPGSLADGEYAVVDVETREVELGQLAGVGT